MFDSIFTTSPTAAQFFIMALAAIVSGFIYAWIMSFKIRAKKRFFMVMAVIPFMVAAVIAFVKGNIGAGVAIGGAFSLIRFRSAQGSADEIAAILIAMGSGIAFGMGYIGYGVVILLGMAVIYLILSFLPIFEHKSMAEDRLLRITIPESLEYSGAFDDTFAHYLKSWENAGVKTTGMGSMFRLSFKIQMKDPSEEKAFIDEIRTKNGNLEIAKVADTNEAWKKITVYNKEAEMKKSTNRSFREAYDISPFDFKDKCRFEIRVNSEEQVRQTLRITNTTLNTVLSTKATPIHDFVDGVLAPNAQTQVNTFRQYIHELVLKDCDYDLQKVEATLKDKYAPKTSMTKILKPYREALNRRNNPALEQNDVSMRDKIMEMLVSI